jgi:hypothetical protein
MAAVMALGLPIACAAAVRSQVDRSTVTQGEPFTLTIESDGASSGVQPDLAPLRQDFALLGSEASSETRIVNGARSDRTRWIIRLQALHPGSVEIPALAVGSDHTAPIALGVTAPSAVAKAEMSEHAFMEVDSAPSGKPLYVQQALPYTVRLYVDGDVQSGSLNPPDAGPDAVVEQIGQETRGTASRHGREYTVIERRYAISPEKSGALKVSPASFQGTVNVPAAPGSADADPADDLMARMLRNSPFANDPMFRSGLMAQLGGATTTRPLTAQGSALAVDVRARPAAAASPWLPAQQLTLHDSWADSPPRFKVGEPVSRVITIEAKGLAASQIPALAPAAPGNARVYPETADNQSRVEGASIDGVSRQTLTYIPSAQGRLDIAPLTLAWWDTTTNEQRQASLPARQFQVEAGVAGQAPTPATAPPSSLPTEASAGGNAARQAASASAQKASDWRWPTALLAALALIAVGVTAAVRRRRRGAPADPSPQTSVDTAGPVAAPLPDSKSSLRALRDACQADDADAAAQALLRLARLEWPDDPPRGLGALAERLTRGAGEVAALDRHLYGADASAWQGGALWQQFQDGLRPAPRRPPEEPNEFDRLYREESAVL